MHRRTHTYTRITTTHSHSHTHTHTNTHIHTHTHTYIPTTHTQTHKHYTHKTTHKLRHTHMHQGFHGSGRSSNEPRERGVFQGVLRSGEQEGKVVKGSRTVWTCNVYFQEHSHAAADSELTKRWLWINSQWGIQDNARALDIYSLQSDIHSIQFRIIFRFVFEQGSLLFTLLG